MKLNRRELLGWSVSATAAATLGAATVGQEHQPADGQPLGADWDAVRRQFRLTTDYVHMAAMLLASHPARVRDGIQRHRDGLDSDPVGYVSANNAALQQRAREAAGGYLEIHPSHVALTENTTTGVGLVYNGLILSPGDEILTTSEDYYVTHEATRLAALKTGATVRRIPLFDDLSRVTVDGLAATIVHAVGPSTRVLALTWVHSSTGLKLPIAAIASGLKGINASRAPGTEVLLCVDGVHGFGVEDASFPELGCDFLMAGCHKWLFGPRGTGIVAASRRGLDRIEAIVPSYISERSFEAWMEGREPRGPFTADTLSPGGFKAFEHMWALPEAFAFHAGIGKAKIAARTHQLASQLKDGLVRVPGVTLRTPRSSDLSAGIVAFDIAGADPFEVVRELRGRGVIGSVAPYASRHVRLTPSILNTPEEIDAAVAVVRSVAEDADAGEPGDTGR